MLYLLILGLGLIGGYGVFFHTFSERCMNLVQASEVRFNTSREEWQTKYDLALSEKEQCVIPLNEMQGRLETQSTLAEHHQALLRKQEDSVAELKDAFEKLQTQVGELHSELERMNQKMIDSAQEKERTETELQNQKSLTEEKWSEQQPSVCIGSLSDIPIEWHPSPRLRAQLSDDPWTEEEQKLADDSVRIALDEMALYQDEK
jgi:chromosome segregation ATPase